MKRGLQLALITTVAIAAGATGYVANRKLSAPPPATTHTVPSAAVETLLTLSLPDTDGQLQSMAQWKGKIIVANFWATWCPPCRKEIPDFAAASQALANDPVQFVGISIDSAEKVRNFNAEFNVPYPLLIAGNEVMGLASSFGNTARALPFTVIIDGTGTVRHIKLGTLHREELERKIRALLPT
jgi:peroxiredoxin